MNYEDFVCFVQAEMKERMGKEVHTELHQIMKNNSVTLDGLSIYETDRSIAPTIYLNEFYEEYRKGMTMPEIMECIQSIYQRSKVRSSFNTDFYMDFSQVKEHLACKLINREKNRELLEKVPYVPFLDLAIVFYYKLVDSEMGNGTILVYDSHRQHWGITKEELFQIARKNTRKLLPEEFLDIRSILESAGEKEDGADAEKTAESEAKIPMFVVTNQENYFGAVHIIFDSLLEEAGKRLKEDFWILPSSIHECILVPASVQMKKEDLEAMVRQVNEKEVAPEDYLSDSVYFYERSLHRLSKM